MQTTKLAQKKTADKRMSVESHLLQFLFQFKITSHNTTGLAPAELLMGRWLHSHSSLLHPWYGGEGDGYPRKAEVPRQRGKRMDIQRWRSCLGSQLQKVTKVAKWSDLKNQRSCVCLGGVVRWGQSEKAL